MVMFRELFNLFEKDIYSEDFTMRERIVYGIAYPLGLIAIAVLAGIIK